MIKRSSCKMFNFRCALCILFFTISLDKVDLLENGMALTPPMGWMSWGYYMCGIKCEADEDKCLNEKLILSVADSFYTEGYQEAGYEYIIIDDCWSERRRDENGKLVADRKRFPRGMKFIADYIHSRGLKFGMYTNIANITCMRYPGSLSHMEIDAQTFAEWGVDYLKVDGCFVSEELLNQGYIKLGQHLNNTNRPMVFSCSWPYYIEFIHSKKPDYSLISKYCNMWRNYHDVQGSWDAIAAIFHYYETRYDELAPHHGPGHWNDPDMPDYSLISKYCNMWRNYHDVQGSWDAIAAIFHYYETRYDELAPHHGPGHWNDPDMLIFGTGVLTRSQSRVQIAMLVMLSAPLLLSCNMKKITPYEKKLLQNLDLIAVGQDPLGIMAEPHRGMSATIWVKPHLPRKGDAYPSYTFAAVNMDVEDTEESIRLSRFQLNATDGYTVLNVFTGEFIMNMTNYETIKVKVPGMDVIVYTLFPL